MWKLAVIALLVIFIIADSIYLYFKFKRYWRQSSLNRLARSGKKWRLGLSSLDLPPTKPEKPEQSPGNDSR